MKTNASSTSGALTRPGLTVLVLAALMPPLLAGCRDATEPTGSHPLEKVTTELPRRLTFSSGDDRSPAWSEDGRHILYTAPGSPPFAETRGLLLRVPMEGGDARPVLPQVQLPAGLDRWLTAPVLDPDGQRLAYVEMWAVGSGELCPGSVGVQCTPAGADSRIPRLSEVFFRVREPESGTTVETDPSVRVAFEGLRPVTPPPGSPVSQVYEVEMHPFHQLFNGEDSFVFRPSWSPDGSRLVLSDGLRLLVWEVGTDQVSPIPGTEDGVHPAWSPDGEWIAFTRLTRGAPLQVSCTHFGTLGPACQQNRTVYPVEGRTITLVRPDGSETREVTQGEEPAWTPDSERLVYRVEGRVAVVSAEGGPGVGLSSGLGAREPAVSPDGSLVAFAKLGDNGSYDIWVASLDPELGR